MPALNSRLPADSASRWSVALLIVAIAAAYGNSLTNSFHYDDFHSIVDNPHIRTLENIPAFFWEPGLFSSMPERAMYRPLLLVTYALNYWADGYEVFGYHLVNLAIHIGCVLLVYRLGATLTACPLAAAVGALFFGLHPLQAETANYISSRSESLAAFWYLLAILCYVRWRANGASPSDRMLYLVSLGAFLLALASKATAVVFPAAVLLWEGCRRGRELAAFPWVHNLGYWIAGVAYVAVVRGGIGSALGQPVRELTHQIYTQIKALPFYLQLAITPAHLSVEHGFHVSTGFWEGPVLLSVLLLVSVLLVIRRRWRALLICGWCMLPLLPASIVPLNVLVNEHRLYLPAAFAAIGLAMILPPLSGLEPRRFYILGAAVLGLATLTAQRNRIWESELTLWTDAVARAPFMYRSQMHLGGVLEAAGKVEEAVDRYRAAAQLAPHAVEVHYNLANGLRQLGMVDEAMRSYERSLELSPGFHNSLLNLSAIYLDRNQLQPAERLLRNAAKHHPQSAEVHRRLGVLLVRQERFEEAHSAYRKALFLRPDLGEAYYNLANLLWTNGRLTEAETTYRQVLAHEPRHLGAHTNLGAMYLENGRYRLARKLFAAALVFAPAEPGFHFGIAHAYEGLGEADKALTSYQNFLRYSVGNHAREQYVQMRVQALKQQTTMENKKQ